VVIRRLLVDIDQLRKDTAGMDQLKRDIAGQGPAGKVQLDKGQLYRMRQALDRKGFLCL
jgi:hypothetical protein